MPEHPSQEAGVLTSRPRPWAIGFRDRGLGRVDFAILDSRGELIAETPDRAVAELIIKAVNAHT